MARKLNIMLSPWAVGLSLAWLIGLALVHWWPASWWMDVHRMTVFPATAHEPVSMRVERSIHRPFVAEWRVRVWREDPFGWEVVCAGKGGGDYRPYAVIPASVSLSWWSNGACSALPAGRYKVSTTWQIRRGVLPDVTLAAESNMFLVSD